MATHAAAAIHVSVIPSPKHVVLGGRGPQKVNLLVEVTDASGKPLPQAQIVVRSTAGSIGDLRRVAPGRFQATLSPPADAFPQLALVSALEVSPVVRGAPPVVGTVSVAYSARISLRGKAEPGSRMRVDVGRKRFGPVTVGADGRFVIPVVVPPGVGWALGVSTDDLGNQSRSKINLYLPRVRQLHAFVYPEVLIADGRDRGWFYVSTLDPKGAPRDLWVNVRPGRGKLGAAETLAVGLVRRPYRAPPALGDGTDRVVLALPKNRVEAEVELRLMAAAPAVVEVTTTPRHAPADGETPVEIRIAVRDAAGNPADGHEVRVQVGPKFVAAVREAAGVYLVELSGRAAVGVEQLPVAVVPRTSECPRPWAGRAPDGTIRVRDVRGILCKLEFAILDVNGLTVHEGKTSDVGELILPPEFPPWESRLVVKDARGGAPDILWVGKDQVHPAVTILHGVAVASWRLPTAVDLRLSLIEQNARIITLALVADGVPAPNASERLAVTSNHGRASLVVAPDGGLSVRVELGAGSTKARPLDVVVTDGPTGISAWLRID